MTILETSLTEDVVSRLIELSRDWENEGSCHGYRANTSDDLEDRRIFLAMEDGQILGYLFGKMETANKTNSIITEGTPFLSWKNCTSVQLSAQKELVVRCFAMSKNC